jgi:hypothetical protein
MDMSDLSDGIGCAATILARPGDRDKARRSGVCPEVTTRITTPVREPLQNVSLYRGQVPDLKLDPVRISQTDASSEIFDAALVAIAFCRKSWRNIFDILVGNELEFSSARLSPFRCRRVMDTNHPSISRELRLNAEVGLGLEPEPQAFIKGSGSSDVRNASDWQYCQHVAPLFPACD